MHLLLIDTSSWLAFPLTNPTVIFLVVLAIILFVPMLFRQLHIPQIVGLILAGMLVGEHGLGLLARDSSFQIFGRVGLFYIMFLAGLEIDRTEFKHSKVKGAVFGIYTFVIPMVLGIIASYWLLEMDMLSSILLASMYASHTLIAYPSASKLGLTKQRSVVMSVAGTVITVTLSLIVLALIVGIYKETTTIWQFIIMFLMVIAAASIVIFVFPCIIRWFFRKFNDNVLQFVFVLAIVFLGATLFEIAGFEGILGAFLAGLVLNKYIPNVSPLMNRIEFVGSVLFIPYFLIGVGMLIDLEVVTRSPNTLQVAVNMTLVATISKWLAAWLTQKTFGMTTTERRILFGLSNAQAAATLAAVLIGYNIGIFNEDILNGTIVMILVTCLISSFATERAARDLAQESKSSIDPDNLPIRYQQRILISVANPETVGSLVDLALLLRHPQRSEKMHALTVINDQQHDNSAVLQSTRALELAEEMGNAVDVRIKKIARYDVNVVSGILRTVKERNISELIIGLHRKNSLVDSFFGSLTDAIVSGINRMVIVIKSVQPLNMVGRMVVAIPENAEYETGFKKWLVRMGRISSRLGAPVVFYGHKDTAPALKKHIEKLSPGAEYEYREMNSWDRDFPDLITEVKGNDLLIIVAARKGSISYQDALEKLPGYLSRYFSSISWMVLYPDQFGGEGEVPRFSNPVSYDPQVRWNSIATLYVKFKQLAHKWLVRSHNSNKHNR